MHRLWRRRVLAMTLMLLAGTLVVGTPRIRRALFRPPGNASTFEAFLAENPYKAKLTKVQVGEDDIYVWHSDVVWLALPSGPSCFVFDASGKLVAFTPTTGDLELEEYCGAPAWRQPSLTTEEVLQAMRRTRGQG